MENLQVASPPASDTASPADRLMQRAIDRVQNLPPPTPEQLSAKAEAEQRDARRKSNERLNRLIEQAGERYAACRLSTFVATTDLQKRVLHAVREWSDRPNRNEGLVLYGPCGTGKDHLAFAVAGHAAWNGSDVAWMYGQDWFGKVRDAMDGDTTEARLVRRLAWPDLTVISDPLPPVGNLTPHQATMLYRVVQGRYQAGKPTIVTINVATDAEADERLGAPTWDRLCDGAWKLFCNWPSHRKPAREVK